MKTKLLIFTLCTSTIFCFTAGFAQNREQQIDSAYTLFNQGLHYNSRELVNGLLQIDRIENNKNVAKLYFLAATFHYYENDVSSSSTYIQLATVEIEGQTNNPLYYRIGAIHCMLLNDFNDLENALKFGLKYGDDFKKSGIRDQNRYVKILREICRSYFLLQDFENAISNANEGLLKASDEYDIVMLGTIKIQSLTNLERCKESIKTGVQIIQDTKEINITNEESIVFKIFGNYISVENLDGFSEVNNALNNHFESKYGEAGLEYLYYLNAQRVLFVRLENYDRLKPILDEMTVKLSGINHPDASALWYSVNVSYVGYFFYKNLNQETIRFISETIKYIDPEDYQNLYINYFYYADILEQIGEYSGAIRYYDYAYLALCKLEQNEEVLENKYRALYSKWTILNSHFDRQYQLKRISAFDSLESQIRQTYKEPIDLISKLTFIYDPLINLNLFERSLNILYEIDSLSLIHEGPNGENHLSALNSIAIIKKEQGEHQESAKILSELFEKNIELGFYHNALYNLVNLFKVSVDNKRITYLINKYEPLLIEDAEDWELAVYFDMKGMNFFIGGRYLEAEEWYQRAADLYGNIKNKNISTHLFQHFIQRLINAISNSDYMLAKDLLYNLQSLAQNYENNSSAIFLIKMIDFNIKGATGIMANSDFDILLNICDEFTQNKTQLDTHSIMGLSTGCLTLLGYSYYYDASKLNEAVGFVENIRQDYELTEAAQFELNSMLALIYSDNDLNKCGIYLDKIKSYQGFDVRYYLTQVNFQLNNNEVDSAKYYLTQASLNSDIPDWRVNELKAKIYWKNNEFERLINFYPTLMHEFFNSVSAHFISLDDNNRRTYFKQFQVLSGELLSFIYYSNYYLSQSEIICLYQPLIQSKGLAYTSELIYSEVAKAAEDIESLRYVAKYESELTDITNGIIHQNSDASIIKSENLPEFTDNGGIGEHLFYSKDYDSLKNVIGIDEALVDIYKFLLLENVDGRMTPNTPMYAYFITSWVNDSLKVKGYFKKDVEQMEDFGLRVYKAFRGGNNRNQIDDLSYNIFWSEIDSVLDGVEKIYYNPDGMYNLINPNTLYSTRESTYLIDKYQTEFVSSNFFKGIYDQSTIKDVTTATVFGDPALTYLEGTNLIDQLAEVDSSRSFGPIPYANEEVKEIGDILENNNISVKTWTGEEATETTFKELQKPGILHLATHGISHTGDDGNVFNYIFLSNDNKNDGFVNSQSIEGIDLENNVLTVLSACETALGEINNGDGVYGLRRSFQIAGTKNLIMSMWKVNDRVTKEFMVTFYDYLSHNQTISTAFFNTVRAIKKKYPDPYFWGAFVLATN